MKNQLLLIMSILIWSACSTPHSNESPPSADGKNAGHGYFSGLREPYEDTAVDIEYTLGRDHYRFFSMGKEQAVSARNTVDGHTLGQGPVDSNQYSHFLKSAMQFINRYQPHPDSGAGCRSPFKITVRVQSESHSLQGCRSSDSGPLSKLIKEGEFLLLYSKN